MENLYCDKILKDYIKYQSRKCGTDANSYVLEEGLPLTFISESSHIINKKIFFCTVLEGKFVREISIINKKMCEINISPVFFKGIILGKQLYKNSYVRGLGDIDIWVDEDCFEKASASLQELGYIKVKKEIEVEKHHLVYLKDIFTVELHRSFITPRLRLDTESFRNHFMFFSVEPDVKVRTLDKSATILHLLYHLYMDIFITYANNHYLVMMGVINKVPRFLFRSYEIALFIEKNYKEIDWEYLINEIKKQKIGKWFKYMLSEIEKIFGPVFQKEFRNVIYRINYYKMFDPWHLYRTITRYGNNNNDLKKRLSETIERGWPLKNQNTDITCKNGKKVCINKEIDYMCEVCYNYSDAETIIIFNINKVKKDFVYSDNFEPLENDGIHLLLCTVNPFEYKSVFVFFRQDKGELLAIPYEINENRIVGEGELKCRIIDGERKFILEVKVNNDCLFGERDRCELYFGYVISVCDSQKKSRCMSWVLTDEEKNWYNPLYFRKLILVN